MKVALTGGSGFIGRYLLKKHLALGDTVHFLTRKSGVDIEPKDRVKVFVGDLTDEESLPLDFVDDVDVLYHCAGEVNHPTLMEKLHVLGTQNLLNLTCSRIGKWVHLSSV